MVSVRLNNGLGSFSAPAAGAEVAVGSEAWAIALGDMDGDGDLDLMTSNTATSGGISVRLNDGRGIFLPPATNPNPAVNGNPSGSRTSLRDIDGDGDLDMLVLEYRQNQNFITILLNQPGSVVSGTRPGAYPAFALAPNPARSAVALIGAAAHAAVQVIDALGRVVLVLKADAMGAVKLVLPAGLPAGVYMVRSGNQVGRLIVE